MNILFLTFAPFGSNESHIRRLLLSMNIMSTENKVSVLCLSELKESPSIVSLYPGIQFYQYSISYDGWRVLNLNRAVTYIERFSLDVSADIVIQTMEVWDLVRECGRIFHGKIPFATIFHAMPFLAAPSCPSGNFKQDVMDHCASGIEKYRVKYIQDHHMETTEILSIVGVICANPTVTHYFNSYFPAIHCSTLKESMIIERKVQRLSSENQYDFVYMARMERGKGIEYLSEILKYAALKLERKVTLALLGRTDDIFSSNVLADLIKDAGEEFEVFYFGWADDELKQKVFSTSGVFIYPSHYDTYGIVLAEALGFGLPCVVWDLPFIEMNYNYIPHSIMKRVQPFDLEAFTLSSIDFMKNKPTFPVSDTFTSIQKLYEEDILCYKKIIHHYETSKNQRP